jgi:hypothetical protein
MSNREGICELCMKPVLEGEAHVRVGADIVARKGDEFVSLNGEQVLVFAVFHADCVLSTMGKDYCEDTEYIWEARAMMEHADLCEECKSKISLPEHTPPQPKKRHLTLLCGGRE